MRAISLWQPWASAVILGHKRIETRHWSTPFTGRMAVHAAKRWTREERDDAEAFARQIDPRLATPPLGAILGTVRLVRCEPSEAFSHISQIERMLGNFAPGRFGWILDDVRAFAEPIPFKGAQGFFDVPDELIARGFIPDSTKMGGQG
ncbi:ASCH domain-containing protein [Sphingomonas sp. CROZ-RG-20F-R02-07]|uniref:ASCH domain-containing protein n=1 Tax=Sphingomonas sp. CROZ-RG-20F-R02-07 TaxID=2914832 RepID=UPI001F579154|nr:ASCH domain-containing protein [Sphingomonas sp. CROZ-RG-20F-R02-07]